jgi:hypothetical protein
METKYVIRMTSGQFLSAGEVVKETPSMYTMTSVDGCPRSWADRFHKSEVVFVTNDRTKLIRMMSLYVVIARQHTAVVEAADKAYRDALAVIISQNPGQSSNVSISEGPANVQS